jgi:hypothetical protein
LESPEPWPKPRLVIADEAQVNIYDIKNDNLMYNVISVASHRASEQKSVNKRA